MKCVHADAEGFCRNESMQGGGFKCFRCEDFTPDNSKTMKKETAVVPEVVEDAAVAAPLTSQPSTLNLPRDGIVKTIAKQIEAVRGAELRSTFEKLKLGAMVKQAVTMLGLDSKGGRGRVGDGVKGWWDENFRGEDGQPVIEYKTLMRWISAAENLPRILDLGKDVKINGRPGRIPMREDEVMALLAKDPEQVIKRSEKKILESAEKVANGMTMRQMLLWGGDDDVRKGRQGGANKGQSGTGRRALTAVEKSEDAEKRIREIVGSLIAFDQGSNFMKIDHTAQTDIILAIKDIVKSFEDQAG